MQVLPLLFSLFSLIAALSCPMGRYQCNDVSTNYNWVDCVNQQCVCRTELGFQGAATTASRCDCPAPYSVYWQGGTPYCIKYQDAVAYVAEQARNQLLKNAIISLYDAIKWPAAASWAYHIATGDYSGSLFDLFDQNVKGVIDPLGNVQGLETTAEYFVGSVWTGITRVDDVFFHRLTVEGNIISINVDIVFGHYSNSTETAVRLGGYNLTQTGTFTVNAQNKVVNADLVIRNVANQLGAGAAIDPVQTCGIIVAAAGCNSGTDPLGYYTDFNDCLAFMSTIPLGTWDNVRQNSVVCRLYHAGLALLRPSVHCPHTGKTGGGKCIPHSGTDYYITNRP